MVAVKELDEEVTTSGVVGDGIEIRFGYDLIKF